MQMVGERARGVERDFLRAVGRLPMEGAGAAQGCAAKEHGVAGGGMAAPFTLRLKCKGVQRWPKHLEVIEHLRHYFDLLPRRLVSLCSKQCLV
jgi:hypothetical protein